MGSSTRSRSLGTGRSSSCRKRRMWYWARCACQRPYLNSWPSVRTAISDLDGQFYQIEVARDGAFVKLQKAENVVLGQVRVPETISEFVAFGENGHFRSGWAVLPDRGR